jgi:hypothetical protein
MLRSRINFFAAPAQGKNVDVALAPAALAPTPAPIQAPAATLLYSKPNFVNNMRIVIL